MLATIQNSSYTHSGNWIVFARGSKVPFEILENRFQYTSEVLIIENLGDRQLTNMAMHFSENSLREVWDNDIDNHWDSY